MDVNAARAELGKRLFYDPRLSGDTSLSCGSCHQPDKAFTDGEALSQAYSGAAHFRNAPTLANVGYREAWMHAIRGELLAPEEAIVPQSGIDGGPDLAAPKSDSDERRMVRISREGEILTADADADPEPTVPRSTLDAIQFSQQAPQVDEAANPEDSDPQHAHLAEETPEESAPKRRRRRSVEGPVTVAVDLTRVALIHAVGIKTFGNLKRARPQSAIIRAMYRTFDRAGDYFALAVKPGGVVQDLVAQKRPVLHKPKHFHPP